MKNIDFTIVIITFVCSIFAGYFAFNDLNISETVVNQQSDWALILQKYGELPGALVIIFGILIFSIQFQNTSKLIFAVTQFVLMLGLSVILLYISFIITFNFTNSHNKFFNYAPFLFITFSVLSISIIITLRKKKLIFSKKTILSSKIIIGMAVFGYILSIQAIKFLWGRIRYRDLDLLHSNFTEWYIANGINGHQSFPSGHAAMGWVLLPLLLLVLNKNLILKSFTLGLIIILAFSIAISRVVIGAHYASDVLFGSFFMIISFLILYKKHICKDEKLRK